MIKTLTSVGNSNAVILHSVEKLRKNKAALYKRIEAQAKDPETIKHCANKANNLSDVDPDIVEG